MESWNNGGVNSPNLLFLTTYNRDHLLPVQDWWYQEIARVKERKRKGEERRREGKRKEKKRKEEKRFYLGYEQSSQTEVKVIIQRKNVLKEFVQL